MPPQKREVPRTRRRLERMEPSKEYFTTKIFCLLKANIAIISSGAFPHVAFRSPPTAVTISRKTSDNSLHYSWQYERTHCTHSLQMATVPLIIIVIIIIIRKVRKRRTFLHYLLNFTSYDIDVNENMMGGFSLKTKDKAKKSWFPFLFSC